MDGPQKYWRGGRPLLAPTSSAHAAKSQTSNILLRNVDTRNYATDSCV